MESIRHSAEDAAWPMRPWICAVVCALAMFVVNRLLEVDSGDPVVWRQVAATFAIVLALAFVLTAELRRLIWAAGFAFLAASVLAFVGWFTAAYNKGREIAEYPFLAGAFALLIAAPLFQTVRDEGAWRFPYARLHSHVWTDAVIGGASFAFTGVSFLLAMLIAKLFELIGIQIFRELLEKGWFSMMLAGFAFGAAMGLLRERDALLATLQKLVLVILSVLSPVLAFALVGFLLSLPFTGLAPLWDSGVPTTPILLFAAAGAVGLINAVIGDGASDGSRSRVLRWSALLLALCILPLALIAAISMGTRIEQHGFTPDRIWGLLAVAVATVYGTAYFAVVLRSAVSKKLGEWDDHVRPVNIRMALGVCALALFLALPVLDFGAVSARDQLARLKAGAIKAGEFDWQAMAFDFGPKGREALARLEKTGGDEQRKSAIAALAAKNRWDVEQQVIAEKADALNLNFSFDPAGRVLDDEGKRQLIREGACHMPCKIIWLGENRMAVVGRQSMKENIQSAIYSRKTQEEADAIFEQKKADGHGHQESRTEVMVWQREYGDPVPDNEVVGPIKADTRIEIRPVEMQRVYVDGAPVGDAFTK